MELSQKVFILWGMLERKSITLKDAESWKLSELPLYRDNQSVKIDADIEDLLQLAFQQNFVPVVDAHNIFIGIVTRKDIMQYFATSAIDSNTTAYKEKTITMQQII